MFSALVGIGSEGYHKGGRIIQTKTQPFTSIVTPIFVQYYEDHKSWLEDNINAEPQHWPSIWNFARVVRNAISHGSRLGISNPKSSPVQWYHLEYGPADDGKEIIGKELLFAELLILLFEMDDELSKLGCPTR